MAVVSFVAAILLSFAVTAWRRRKTVAWLRKTEWAHEHKQMHIADLNLLPEPVRKYLANHIVEGRDQVRFAAIKQRGKFRSISIPEWGKLSAYAYHTGTIPGLVWHARIKANAFLWRTAELLYSNGYGSGYVRFMGIFTISDPSGEDVGASLLTRILMECVWVPTSFIPTGCLRWEPIDSHHARAIIKEKNKSVSATFTFNENYEITEVVTHDKYRDGDGGLEREECTMKCSDYRTIDGLKIPTRVQLVWNLEEGDFEYADIEVLSARYE